jgi:hypothetical protein
VFSWAVMSVAVGEDTRRPACTSLTRLKHQFQLHCESHAEIGCRYAAGYYTSPSIVLRHSAVGRRHRWVSPDREKNFTDSRLSVNPSRISVSVLTSDMAFLHKPIWSAISCAIDRLAARRPPS